MRRSFRDPAGSVHEFEGRVFRAVDPGAAAHFVDLLGRPAVKALQEAGTVVASRIVGPGERERLLEALHLPASVLLVEHPRVEFPSYPYEWPPEMLHVAGALTLDLAESLLEDDLGLKDATPYNILFRGSSPVFVDVASIEVREPGDDIWLAYAQFMRTFVLPLQAVRRFGLTLGQVFLAQRDGLEPEQLYAMAGWSQRCTPALLWSVSIPTWLGSHRGTVPYPVASSGDRDPARARFVLFALFRRLRRQLDAAKPEATRSTWSGYASNNSYTPVDFAQKEAFVGEVLQSPVPATVLDLGGNTGHFSGLAAAAGASTVAIDLDAVSVGEMWRRAVSGEGKAILPLVANIARPSPGLGWRNAEQEPLLQRLSGRFDLVLMLALLHHLLVTDGVPLSDVLALAADLSRDRVLIEYVPPSDAMFRTIARGRDSLHAYLTPQHFESVCQERFHILRMTQLESGRRLYLLRRSTGLGPGALAL